MKRQGLILNMLIFGAGFALLGAMYTADGPWGWEYGSVIFGVVGAVLGAAVGGCRFAESMIYGPRDEDQRTI